VSVRFPDNLTTWVATARAQTGSARFGQGVGTALVTKDVIARLALPSFLVRGDTATVAGVAQNTLARPLEGTVTAALT
ncbi:alpha-2-macroglobulin family protein, partial [Deinococcus pimensis]|uniref:alpha-2-macroglobulin family protein n=1 Tax=Deinococcus pimensis TaxID=309888 RepID=UPI0005EB8855